MSVRKEKKKEKWVKPTFQKLKFRETYGDTWYLPEGVEGGTSS